jgi:hypothetical protein
VTTIAAVRVDHHPHQAAVAVAVAVDPPLRREAVAAVNRPPQLRHFIQDLPRFILKRHQAMNYHRQGAVAVAAAKVHHQEAATQHILMMLQVSVRNRPWRVIHHQLAPAYKAASQRLLLQSQAMLARPRHLHIMLPRE